MSGDVGIWAMVALVAIIAAWDVASDWIKRKDK